MSSPAGPAKGLLDLPPEIHDHIFSYLDWDRTQHLSPERNDILKISLTCKHLRRTVIPTLFRHVTLRFRWAQDVLLEPTLYRLRKHLPHLARHVQTVTINAEFEPMDHTPSWVYLNRCEADEIRDSWSRYKRRFQRLNEHPAFVTGTSPDEWVNPSQSHAKEDQPSTCHVERVKEFYTDLTSQFGATTPAVTWSADEQEERRRLHYDAENKRYERTLALALQGLPINDRLQLANSSDDDQSPGNQLPASADLSIDNRDSRLRLQLQALALAASCIPGSVTRLIVHAMPAYRQTGAEHNFALATAAAAIRMLGPGLCELTIDTADSTTRDRRTTIVSERTHITTEIVDCLSKLKILRLGNLSDRCTQLERKLECWTCIQVQTLELWNYTVDSDVLFSLLAKISTLRELHFRRLVVQNDNFRIRHRQNLGFPIGHAATAGPAAIQPAINSDADQDDPAVTYLLHFAIGVREVLPETIFTMDLVTYATPGAQAFIRAHVAHTPGRLGEGRRQRLLQDFKYFSPMWQIEANAQPRSGDAKQFAGLIDAAMFARSKYQWS